MSPDICFSQGAFGADTVVVSDAAVVVVSTDEVVVGATVDGADVVPGTGASVLGAETVVVSDETVVVVVSVAEGVVVATVDGADVVGTGAAVAVVVVGATVVVSSTVKQATADTTSMLDACCGVVGTYVILRALVFSGVMSGTVADLAFLGTS